MPDPAPGVGRAPLIRLSKCDIPLTSPYRQPPDSQSLPLRRKRYAQNVASPHQTHGATRPTMADVARLARVSSTTVSFVVNDKTSEKISEPTRRRVLAAVDQLGYRPNRAAQNLRTRRTATIGFVIHEVADESALGPAISGAHDAAWRHGSRLIMVNTDRSPTVLSSAIDDLLDRQVDTIVVAAVGTRRITLPDTVRRAHRPAQLLHGGQRPTMHPARGGSGRTRDSTAGLGPRPYRDRVPGGAARSVGDQGTRPRLPPGTGRCRRRPASAASAVRQLPRGPSSSSPAALCPRPSCAATTGWQSAPFLPWPKPAYECPPTCRSSAMTTRSRSRPRSGLR